MAETARAGESLRQRYHRRIAGLKQQRASWEAHWQDLADFILPRRMRLNKTNVSNQGSKMNQRIYDSTATLAARSLRSGMLTGLTNPASEWFRLTTPYPELNEVTGVKTWLRSTEDRIREVFQRSNIYNALAVLYGDLGVFGTAAMMVLEDQEKVIRSYPFVIGTYYLAQNDKLVVDTIVREFPLTVRQVVTQFALRYGRFTGRADDLDWSKVSLSTKALWDNRQYETPIDVCHVIEPNDERKPGRAGYEGMAWRSCYFEAGTTTTGTTDPNADGEKVLSEGGFEEFPVMAPRWDVTGEDVYGSSPGMEALGDIKGLQLYEKRAAQLVDKGTNPPLNAPSSMKTVGASLLPGDVNYHDNPQGMQRLEPTYAPDPRWLQMLQEKMYQHQERIKRQFFEDLFLMLANDDRRQPVTAREIEERHEEKLLMLGPVLHRQNGELLDPLIDRTFNVMLRRGLLEEAPEELQGQTLRVEYISRLATAMKLTGTAGLERLAGFVAQTAPLVPSILDKVEWDQVVDEYGDMLGVPPAVILTDDQVTELRAEKAKQQQMQAALAAAQPMADAANKLGNTPMQGDTALTRLMGQSGPPAAEAQAALQQGQAA